MSDLGSTVESPQDFCVAFRTNCSVKICMQGYKLQGAKLNLFADKGQEITCMSPFEMSARFFIRDI